MASRKLEYLDFKLRSIFISAKKQYEKLYPDREVIVTCTNRSIEEQSQLYAQGRTKPGNIITQIDGINKKSKHNYNPSRAFDVAILLHGKLTWELTYYKEYAVIVKKNSNIIWGGDWKTFKDYPHFELK